MDVTVFRTRWYEAVKQRTCSLLFSFLLFPDSLSRLRLLYIENFFKFFFVVSQRHRVVVVVVVVVDNDNYSGDDAYAYELFEVVPLSCRVACKFKGRYHDDHDDVQPSEFRSLVARCLRMQTARARERAKCLFIDYPTNPKWKGKKRKKILQEKKKEIMQIQKITWYLMHPVIMEIIC